MSKENELIEKLNEASKPDDVFVIKIEHNNEKIVEEVSFSVSKYLKTTINAPKVYYMLLDFSRKLQKELEIQDRENRIRKKE
jgi:response regulator of citrate/malate metabolism